MHRVPKLAHHVDCRSTSAAFGAKRKIGLIKRIYEYVVRPWPFSNSPQHQQTEVDDAAKTQKPVNYVKRLHDVFYAPHGFGGDQNNSVPERIGAEVEQGVANRTSGLPIGLGMRIMWCEP